MPFVRIDLLKGRSEPEIAAIGNAIHHALVECLNVPERDHFQVITEHAPGRLIYDPAYLDGERSNGIVFVQVFLSSGRTTEQKKAFYSRAASRLESEAGVRPQDATIVLVENAREDWSFGHGIAQYLVLAKEQWK
ncbi:MAG TPA: tautomerase family protein [Burkholderiales bacterium]|jgi:phenylpyruvate tautomerase PptA (4-oxalocrotonate tautomerase family)|nr:tautomerase family protein [Burkholderiales bacterium]